jgi:prepilin-type N-terminal cleavage/methylation domain-containing protein
MGRSNANRIDKLGTRRAELCRTWRGRPRDGGRNEGFTLLEMLVAVAILAVLVSLIPRSFVYARAIINRSESWTGARLVAEAVLNGELASGNLRPGSRRGEMDGHSWVATLKPNETLNAGVQASRILLEVNLQVAISPKQNFEVQTMRIGSLQ